MAYKEDLVGNLLNIFEGELNKLNEEELNKLFKQLHYREQAVLFKMKFQHPISSRPPMIGVYDFDE